MDVLTPFLIFFFFFRLEKRLAFMSWLLGKDEVAGSNPAISSITPEHVVSMGSGVFLLPEIMVP